MTSWKRWALAGAGILCLSGLPARPAAACPLTWDPVCGVDDVTYTNECFAGAVELACEGACPCWSPDRVYGQPNFTETAYNEVVPDRTFHAGGVLIDRLASPNPSRVWVWDAGNNRILGFSHIGTCSGGSNPSTPCTENSICTGGGTCTANLNQSPTVVLGQANGTLASCNRDNTSVAAAASNRLCAIPYPYQPSPLEGPRANSMAVDANHNLYVVDPYNNRILRYDDPFANDSTADWVWGQSNFTDRECNRGGSTANNSLCTGELTNFAPNFYFATGLDVTADGAYVWVADLGNHRVLRINTATSAADLVIGQSSYTANTPDCNLASTPHTNLCKPNSVQFDDSTGRLYVLHGDNETSDVDTAKVFVYDPPLVSGMSPTSIIGAPSGSNFKWPRGITLDPTTANSFWLNDVDNSRVLQYVNGTPTRVLSKADFTTTGCIGGLIPSGSIYPQVCNPAGGVGIDRDGSVYVTDWQEQHIERFPGPIPTPLGGGVAYSPDARLWFEGMDKANHLHINEVSAKGLANPGYALYAGSQLVIADRQRIVFWNAPSLGGASGSAGAASGVLAQPNFGTQADPTVTHGWDFRALGHDATRNLLYAAHGPYITAWSTSGGLTSTAAAQFQISSPLPLIGGAGSIAFEASGIAVDAATDSAWISDSARHRILRILDVSQSTRKVDAVIGQPDLSTFGCNRGTSTLSANSFCIPTQTVFDYLGNLYVVDGTWEANGNLRVLQFESATLPSIPSPQVTWSTGGPMADRVYTKPSFSTSTCLSNRDEQPCVPRFVSFEPGTNRMFLSVDAYSNPLMSRVFIYNDPNASTAPTPDNRMRLPFNQAAASTWDSAGRLAILDHTWNRALLFNDVPVTPPTCRKYDGDVTSCDAAPGCAYYYCSGQCHRQGRSNCEAGCKEDC